MLALISGCYGHGNKPKPLWSVITFTYRYCSISEDMIFYIKTRAFMIVTLKIKKLRRYELVISLAWKGLPLAQKVEKLTQQPRKRDLLKTYRRLRLLFAWRWADAFCSFHFFSEFSFGEASSACPPWLRRRAHVCMCVAFRTLAGYAIHNAWIKMSRSPFMSYKYYEMMLSSTFRVLSTWEQWITKMNTSLNTTYTLNIKSKP